MSITLYEAPFSSATPVACALAELGVPHERVRFDLTSGIQKQPEFLALNPNGKVPTLVVDGTPMFEALAIVQWLADRYGVARGLWPAADAPDRLQALSWSTWAYVSFGSAVQRRLLASNELLAPELRSRAQQQLAEQDIERLLGILDRRLSERAFVLGAQYSLVDLVIASALTWARFTGVSLEAHAHVTPWLGVCQARAAFKQVWTQAA
ncbi:MAG: glutathione S-transferase family protein [Myxococcales bacterium]